MTKTFSFLISYFLRPSFRKPMGSRSQIKKVHLKSSSQVVGDTLFTYEEMITLLTQIEAVLNSRPLRLWRSRWPQCFNSNFLTGSAINTIPEPSLESVKLSRWQLTRKMLESFWTRWLKECLQRHLVMYKWNRLSPSLRENSLVLIVDERYPPSNWSLGRIIEVYPEKDGQTRVVVYPYSNFLKRPVVCPLLVPNPFT